jgi:hypothetical protein
MANWYYEWTIGSLPIDLYKQQLKDKEKIYYEQRLKDKETMLKELYEFTSTKERGTRVVRQHYFCC